MNLDQWRGKRRRREFFLSLVVYGVGAAAFTLFALLASRILIGAV